MSEIKAIKGTVIECEYDLRSSTTEQIITVRLDSGEEQTIRLWANEGFFETVLYIEGDSVTCLVQDGNIVGMRRN